MNKISWGIIGCGDVTEIKSGPAFNKVAGSELVAVMRRNAAKARDYAERHGVAKWYSNAEELINDPDVNAIYIATPPLYHEEYALKCIAAGKPVYIEKPVSLDAAGAQRIADAAASSGVKVSIAHYRRKQPLFLKIKSLIDEGHIGRVNFIGLLLLQPHNTTMVASTEEPWRLDPSISGGGLFHDLAPHQLDLMYYFFGKPKEVSGTASNLKGFYNADDTVAGQILFEPDIRFLGSWSFVVHPSDKKDECLIKGDEGSIKFSVFEPAPLILHNIDGEQEFRFDPLPHVQQPMIAEVVRYFLGESTNPCSPEEAVEVMKMIDAMTAH